MCSNQLCTLPEFGEEKTIVGKLSHGQKKIFQKAYLRYISVYFGRKSKKKRFIIHGEGLYYGEPI